MSKDLRKRIFLAGIFLLIVTATGTTGYYLMGHFAQGSTPWRVSDCFYMTVITLTTVGFGEVIDLTHVPGARLFTIFILLGGIGVAMYFVSTLTAFLVEGELTNVFWRKRMEKQIRKLTDHVILCGAEKVGAGTTFSVNCTRPAYLLFSSIWMRN
ncbi:MAG: potassium channel family protein [Desulfobulbaceae bacterium]|nr:potassium channel family protein [Desulfobulbaceae bacterium]